MIPYGVNNPKNIIPNIIGLIILPSRSPKDIHNLFNGSRRLSLISVMLKNNTDKVIQIYPAIRKYIYKQYIAATKKMMLKKKPKFLLDGSLILEKFIFISILNFFFKSILIF